MGSVREGKSGFRSGAGYRLPVGRYLRNSVPAADGADQYRTAGRVSSADWYPRSNRPRPPSWQARNRWYSQIIATLSIGALVVVLLIGLLK